ncbi:O-antigen ligase family protein [Vitiosangium sp. GDMCC 1.1324]|uniref:O-antigen ligase family protein n=1 Tax=Vitiosangium sp. (strain GDMCC 1.1324) TaxID=2138576 RepID=UPI000D350BE5|nr:O-antigen ligase family protein [Vitiosangium sp. GDMCC 1.1324]PTL76366.1 polymerase [Vitiosangium sp. GDMCC 1.1324]
MSPASSSRSRTSRYALGAEALLAVLLVLLPLALGGAPLWVHGPLVVLGGLAFVLACVGAWRQRRSLHLPLLALPLGAGALLCLLQLIPLPPGLLDVLSPEAAGLRDFALVPLGLDGARPLSLDPPATWRELARYLAYLLIFVAAVQVCRSGRARHRLLSTLAFSGAAVAVVGLLHALLGLDRLFGVISFVHARPPLLTPFGNPNHLAAFLGLSATVSLGLALSSGSRTRAVPFVVATVLGGAGVLLSLSRGGIAFFIFGQLAFALLLFGRRAGTERARAWNRGGAVLLCLLAVLTVGAQLASERLVAELETADSVEKLSHSKVELWPVLASVARAYPLGMGRGAFESAFPRYQERPVINTLTHPENAVLQLATEWGVPGLLLLAVGLWGFVRLWRREGLETVELAVLAGVAALGLHDLFDFSLELPASAVAAWVALASVARPDDRERSEAPRGHAPLRVLAVGGVLTGVALAALLPGWSTLRQAEEELGALVAARAPLDEVRARGLALMDQHPADHALQDLMGIALAEEGRPEAVEALAFANRALFLNPVDARAHRVAARALLTLGRRTQAFLEYRLAFEAGDREVLWHEALERARTLAELQSLTPDSARDAVQLATELMRTRRHEAAIPWLAWARERFDAAPELVQLWEREARLRLERGELEGAEAASEEVTRRAPDALSSYLLRADVLHAQGRNGEALEALEALRPRFPGNVELSFTLARLQVDAGLTRRARETLQQVSPFVSNLGQRAQLFMLEGSSFEKEGHRARALESWKSAVRIQPGAGMWFKVARLHESLYQFDAAARAVREGMALQPVEQRAEGEAWVARLEAAERQRVEARRRERDGGPDERDRTLRAMGSDEDVDAAEDEAP